MHVDVIDPGFQTVIFIVILLLLVVITSRKDSGPHEMNHSHTLELKGLAILMVIFSHIGYFLFTDHRFLYPLSIAGGIGVNIFLFLSGFGLTSSAMTTKTSVISFYSKRLKNIFIPMWLVLAPILLIDMIFIGRMYNSATILQSIVGFFPDADISLAINSPLWYFTLILFYYLIFPLVYRSSRPVLSIIIVLLAGLFAVNIGLPVSEDVLKLYRLHFLAFPLGMAFSHIDRGKFGIRLNDYLLHLSSNNVVRSIARYIVLLVLFSIFAVSSIYSGIGGNIVIEQMISLAAVVITIAFFLIKDIQIGLLVTLGRYSYEIYLIQWPLLYRYDLLYKHMPAYLGTVLYIILFIAVGFLLNKLSKIIVSSIKDR